MRKVILDLAVSLDGFIEGTNGEIDWCIMDDDMDFDGFLESIDIFRISVHPVALGSGKPLFEDLKERINLRLIKSNTFKSGVVQLIYEPKK